MPRIKIDRLWRWSGTDTSAFFPTYLLTRFGYGLYRIYLHARREEQGEGSGQAYLDGGLPTLWGRCTVWEKNEFQGRNSRTSLPFLIVSVKNWI